MTLDDNRGTKTMALRGRAFLAIWHDVAAAGEAEFNAWHTRQHMPERVGVPGFLAGRRYADLSGSHQRYFTLYEGATLETFSSDGYRARLNNPTAWSIRSQPHFRNLTRAACVVVASLGRGFGGVLATLRFNLATGAVVAFEAAAEKLACRIFARDGVTAVHLGVAALETTRIRTKETELRGQTEEDVFDAVIMVEGIGRNDIEAAMDAARAMLHETVAAGAEHCALYDLAYLITAQDVA
jgi:hypothetical protein